MSEVKVLGPYQGLEVRRREITVTEQEVLDELERAKTYASKQESKGDAPAEMGDTLQIDFVGYFDDEPFPGGDGENYPLTLGSGQFIPGFEEQLVGAKKGDQVDVKVNFPENYHSAAHAGKPAVFKVTVREVNTMILPELTDEVVQKISGMATVAEFKEYVRGEIMRSKMSDWKVEKETYLIDRIMEQSEVEVTEDEITERAETLKRSLLGNLQQNGSTIEDFLGYHNITMEQYEERNRQDAKEMLMGQALLQAIAKAEGITHTEEELASALQDMAKSYALSLEQLNEMIGENGAELVAQDIVSQKVLHFLNESAKEIVE